jgi:hypothetical protein
MSRSPHAAGNRDVPQATNAPDTPIAEEGEKRDLKIPVVWILVRGRFVGFEPFQQLPDVIRSGLFQHVLIIGLQPAPKVLEQLVLARSR